MNKWILTGALLAAAWGWQQRRPPTSDRLPADAVVRGELVQTIVDDGADVDLQAFLQPDVWTLFEYTADW